MGFKRLTGVDLTYNQQIMIYAQCVNYKAQPKEVQAKIKRVCKAVGKEHQKALFELLTKGTSSAEGVACRHNISPSTLYDLRRKFYRIFFYD